MEINEKTNLSRYKDFLVLIFLAVKRYRLQTFSMVRNYLMFLTSTTLVRVNPIFKRSVKVGVNVRIQRHSTLRIIGSRASIQIDSHSIIYENALLEATENAVIKVGECSVLGDCRISARDHITIGKRALLSWNVFIQDYDPHPLLPEIRAEQVRRICDRFYPKFSDESLSVNDDLLKSWRNPSSPIIIGDDVWIGAGVIILKGVILGDGCVVASGSVVASGVYPARSVLAGNPAKVVKKISDFEAQI